MLTAGKACHTSLTMPDAHKRAYKVRLNRLAKLIELEAPVFIIANEMELVLMAALKQPITITPHEPPPLDVPMPGEEKQ